MKELQTTIIIDAPVASVWQILTDREAYPQWNPFIKEMQGDLAVGKTLRVNIQPPGQKAMIFKPQVKVYTSKQELRWLGHLLFPGIFDGEHYFLLEAVGDQQTQLTHGENFSGLLAGLLFKMIGANTKAGFEAMNQALKQRTEKAHAV